MDCKKMAHRMRPMLVAIQAIISIASQRDVMESTAVILGEGSVTGSRQNSSGKLRICSACLYRRPTH